MPRTAARRRGRRPYQPPRCDHCKDRIRFFWITFARGPVKLPFDAIEHVGGADNAYPVFAGRAWDINDLIAEVQVMRGVDDTTARNEVFDLPWYRLHRCPQGAAARRRPREEARS